VVGPLQLDVLKARLQAEYNLATRFEDTPYESARWLDAERAELDRFRAGNSSSVIAEDHDGIPVFLARNSWDLRRMMEDWPQVKFRESREQN